MNCKRIVALYLICGLASCASYEVPEELFEPIERDSQRDVVGGVLLEGEEISIDAVGDLPKPIIQESSVMGERDRVETMLPDQSIIANYRDMPVPEFLNEVLGEQLGLSYIVDPGIGEIEDLVTLSLSEPMRAVEFYRAVRSVLAQYGISLEEEESLVRVKADRNASGAGVPILVAGSALPEVPSTHRPVFAIVPVQVLRAQQVISVLEQLYMSSGLEIRSNAERNSLILQGDSDSVEAAIEAVKLLDQPLLMSKFSKSFRSTFIGANELAGNLVKVLTTEGYAATMSPPFGSIIILPFERQQRLLIFANRLEVLRHTLDWARELDDDYKNEDSNTFFSYLAKDVSADHIARLLSSLHGQSAAQGGGQEGRLREEDENMAFGSSSGGSSVSSYMGGKVVVDGNRNILFFKGSGQEWSRLRKLIEEIDQPVPMVLIDVLLAEIRLTDGEESGVEWLFRSGGPLGTKVTGSNLGGLSLGGSGMSLTFDSAGETRALVNAFYNNDRASIRSSPKLLVKSGENATIEVGNEIPILTSSRQSTDTSDAPVLQSIDYRKTGVLLKINPLVQAGGLVDLDISQELSEQQATGIIGSPTILNRKIETSLSLSDGGSVLLGGLISNSQSKGQVGLPPVGRIPLIGKLFRVETQAQVRTELIMLVTTYVINNHDEAMEITEILRNRLNLGE